MTDVREIPILPVLEDSKNIFDSEKKFEIPLYQREFAWKERQLQQLIDDIYDFEGETYYIGSMVVYEKDNSYEVIDGQQRLTALFLLLNYLKTRSNKIQKVKPTLIYSCRDKSKYSLENIDSIINEDKQLEENLIEPTIQNGIIDIRSYFESNKKNLDIEKFIINLKKVVIFRIEVPKNTDLNRYFEIMNTRGEQLEQVDIIKAKLMSYLYPSIDDENIFALIWNACCDMNGYVQMHFRFERTEPRNRIFSKSWNEIPSANWNDYNILNKYKEKINSEDDEIFEKYKSIIEFPYFLLHCLKSFIIENKINDISISLDDKKLLKSFDTVINLYKGTEQKADFSKGFILHLLRKRFLFDKYIIKRYHENKDDDGVWSLEETKQNNGKPERVLTILLNNKNIMYLQSAMRVSYTAPKNMNWITEILVWLGKNENLSNMSTYEVFVENIIKSATSNFFKLDNYNKLGVETPHIVLNYLDYLLWKSDRPNDFVFEYRNSVEHWYPQTPSENTFPKWDDVDRFGNLCLIQRNINSRFSNKTPESKKNDHAPMIAKGSLKLRKMNNATTPTGTISAHENWVNLACLKHENEMLNKLREACGIELVPFEQEAPMATI